MKIFLSLCIGLSFLGFSKDFQISRYLQGDGLQKEIGKKKLYRDGRKKSLYEETRNLYKYPSFDDFWKFASEYWLVKNIKNLKWNRGRREKSFEKKFSSLLKKMSENLPRFKVFIFPTSWIPHFVLPRGKNQYFFFISQKFLDTTRLSTDEVSMLLLEDLKRIRRGDFYDFLKNEEFYKKLGKTFFKEKKPAMGEFEKLMMKVTLFYRYYGYTFESQFKLVKSIEKALGEKQRVYRSYLGKAGESYESLIKAFHRFESVFPGTQMKQKWIK